MNGPGRAGLLASRDRWLWILPPLVALAGAWILLHAARPGVWGQVPGGRSLGVAVVLLLALGALGVALVVGWQALRDARGYRLGALLAFLVLSIAFAVGQEMLGTGPAGSGWIDAAVTQAYGPLVIWPALWLAVPELGAFLLLPLGRLAVLLATTATLTVAGTVALARYRASREGQGRTGGAMGAGTACTLATTACPACAPPLVGGLTAIFGAGALAPWLAPLTDPGSLLSEALAAAGPLMGVVALLVAAPADPEGTDGGARTGVWGLVGASFIAGTLLAIPVALLYPLPIGATPKARSMAALYDIVNLLGLAVLLAFEILLVGLILWNRGNQTPDPDRGSRGFRSVSLAAWIGIPLVLLLAVAFPALDVIAAHPEEAPDGPAYEVEVQAMNWGWVFTHPDGEKVLDQLTVPAGSTVHLKVTSSDVVHSVYVPDLGVKVDAVPARLNHQVFVADTPGTYRGACAEFCGIGHPQMDFRVVVAPAEEPVEPG